MLLACAAALLALVAGGAPVHAVPALQLLAATGGQPDDIAVTPAGRLVWGNLSRGTLEMLSGGHVTTVASGLSVPEGVIPLRPGAYVVAEQGADRVVRVAPGGRRTVIITLRPVAGQDGVDGIGRDARTGDLLVPDSPRGRVLRMDEHGRHVRVIAAGLGRPVDAAADAHGNVLVPDEHLGTLVVISPRGRVSYRGSFSTPDDVVVDGAGRVWVTSLGDSGLWLLPPGGAPRRILAGLTSPQGLTLDRCGDPIVVEQTTARIERVLLTGKSARCPL